ncbi:hypothetical protein [Zunongwangia pacifica]|uniref:Uncharacterized protein n=1 Tax=Zunongwangia pacifica TaxID=2911062 RepID=A0A9X2A201_9FLAO|nr:hypothetical protein [Zunongwangia pacifica]MCL6220616.1 hypothetical protein [Zunongwangia pacifica]
MTIETIEAGKLEGTVIQVKDHMVLLELTKTDHGVKSNVVLTIKLSMVKNITERYL